MITKEQALRYHAEPRPGKLTVRSSKACETQEELSLAYTPGVAEPCLEIEKDPAAVYQYTNKGNLVAVISNGTAVLGLGNIGAAAGKPVMEGKGVLFKRFADVDVYDIELDTRDPDEVIRIVKAMEPTFGGINLEDIKAPECFYIEETLKREMPIPVFHDDQHGTAIISGAALLNACEVQGKKLRDCRIVISGAGAAAISCALHYEQLGARHENILLCDRKGVIHCERREPMDEKKRYFAANTKARDLADALEGADIFIGLSVGGIVSTEMIRRMADKPVLFPMANPLPEIAYEQIRASRPDAVAGTGRSDYPNQVNNVLGFPFIFRGALDVRAACINEAMKIAATHALAALAKENCIPEVEKAYGGTHFEFGPDYLIPKPFDPRVFIEESLAVAEAAVRSGVAGNPLKSAVYRRHLEERLQMMRKSS
ncbi:MAG: malate dehydrogenase [Candidatus Marinimicrobia bacterium]|jgi:malate dehydrogenase (oxaloacetate-decarboxylating)(NADP+)|nr:malate dehydrogenase [Candidatus Neomarinimicrobiota bacterium]MDD4960777.1 malate dehydrogenase [Candidatus Neomarinimicrobiota bacterium]MDD5708993.1 malate dehydrogenase [Candidatus Neomarinimicrobiota bacterium]MDX9778002.1 malic enzyme-like NAD(P)-binding protein [bacterium]